MNLLLLLLTTEGILILYIKKRGTNQSTQEGLENPGHEKEAPRRSA